MLHFKQQVHSNIKRTSRLSEELFSLSDILESIFQSGDISHIHTSEQDPVVMVYPTMSSLQLIKINTEH